MSTDTQLSTLLDALTEAILQGGDNIDDMLMHYDNVDKTVHDLVKLAYQLRGALIPKTPSGQFAKTLKQELLGRKEPRWRILHMPGRIQAAAGVAAVAAATGVAVIAARRYFVNDRARLRASSS